MQRPAKPFTPVRFRLQPPLFMNKNKIHILVSGGFDPIHSGHINLINNAAEYGEVIVILNNEKFLEDKKGYSFMTVEERVIILENLKNVYKVFVSIDDDHTVCKSIKYLANSSKYNIKYFANGGDRKNVNDVPESKVCIDNNIETIFNIGGEKSESSSSLTQKFFEKMLLNKNHEKIYRKPWGYYINLISEGDYIVKKLFLKTDEELSKQSHHHREEHWVVVKGEVDVLNGKHRGKYSQGDYIYIEKGIVHKIANPYGADAVIIEIQLGNILSESDITRFEDKYKR